LLNKMNLSHFSTTRNQIEPNCSWARSSIT